MRGDRANPYVGLDFFVEDDAELFFGRDAERKRIIGNLRASRLTLLYAQSGVGKSSLLRAGVAARLRAQGEQATAQGGSPRYLPIVFCAWREDPVAGLVAAIGESVRPFLAAGSDLELPADSLDDALQIAAAAVDATPLIILDQFEEFFLYHERDEAGQRFADGLARSLQRPDVSAHFLLSIREDSYARIGDHFKDRIPNVYANYLHLEYLDERAARAAITQPLARLGNDDGPSEIQDELVAEVLRQVRRPAAAGGANGSGAKARFETAYLQLVMERLWGMEHEQRSDVLRLETLTTLGGAQSIIRRHLDDALDGLGCAERDAAAAAFRFLVTSGGTKIALTPGELADFTSQPEPLLETILERLREARILRPVSLNGEGGGYELFHDVLGEAVLEWRKRHDAERHEQALLAERADEERQKLVKAAERHAEQRAILVRRAVAALSVLVVVLAAAVAWALIERGAAEHARERARSQELAAAAVAQLPLDPERSVLLAQEAWKTAHTGKADAALRQSLSASPARGRFAVGMPREAMVSEGGETLASHEATRLTLWRPDARSADPQPGQPPAAAGLLSVQPVDRDAWLLAIADSGRTVAFYSGGETQVLRAARGARPVALQLAAEFAIALSRDGRYAAGTDPDGLPRIWRVSDGTILATFPRNGPALIDFNAFAFDPADSGHVVAGDCRGRLTSWRWRSAAATLLVSPATSRPVGYPKAVCQVAVSPGGKRAAETLRSGSAVLWNLEEGRAITARLGDDYDVADIAFSRDGRRVATASRKGAAVFDAHSGRTISRMTGHRTWVGTVTFSPNGDRLLTSSHDASARVWDVATGTQLTGLYGHTGAVLDARFSRTGNGVLSVSTDGSARAWSLPAGRVLRGHTDWVQAAAFAPDGRGVATVDARGHLLRTDLATGRQRGDGSRPGASGFRQLSSVAYDRTGTRLVLAGEADAADDGPFGLVRLVDAKTLNAEPPFMLPQPARMASLSPDGRWLVAAAFDRPQLWRVSDRKQFELATPEPWSLSAAFSPDGRSIVTAGDDMVRIFELATRKLRRVADGANGKTRPLAYPQRGVAGAILSPDGSTVLSFGADATAHLWDARTERTRRILRGHTDVISSAAFNRDGTRVVTGGGDQTTRVWDVDSGRLLSTQYMHGDFVNSVAFAPDGRTILSASDDRTTRIYPCATCASTDALADLSQRRVFFGLGEREDILKDG